MCSDCPDDTCSCFDGWTDPYDPTVHACGFDKSHTPNDPPSCKKCDHDGAD